MRHKKEFGLSMWPEFRKLAELQETSGGCGIGLVLGREVFESAFGEDGWEGDLIEALSVEKVIGILDSQMQNGQFPPEDGCRAEFMSLLALHPDSRLREVAAQEIDLSDVAIRYLMLDKNDDVRCRLSCNPGAMEYMRMAQLQVFVRDDPTLVENATNAMLKALTKRLEQYESMKDKRATSVEAFNLVNQLPRLIARLQTKIQQFLALYVDHPDETIRKRAQLLQQSIQKRHSFVLWRNVETSESLGLSPIGQAYALAYLQWDACNAKIVVDRTLPKLVLSIAHQQ